MTSAEAVCAECGVADRDWEHPATQHVVPHPDSQPGNSGRHPFKPRKEPEADAVAAARGRVVKSYLDAAWRKPPITSRVRERGDAQAERLVNAMVNRFDEGPLADLIAAALGEGTS